jgi:hypothetical protein
VRNRRDYYADIQKRKKEESEEKAASIALLYAVEKAEMVSVEKSLEADLMKTEYL